MPNLNRPEHTLAKLNNLKELRLFNGANCKDKDWSFIKNLNNLEILMASPDADFLTISQLKTLKQLFVSWTEASGNQLPSLDQLKDFQHLEKLTFEFKGGEKTLTADDLNKLKGMLPGVELKVTGRK
jgi:hypothetical protein